MPSMAEGRTDRSPFPGMDPYLESHWEDVHARLIGYAADAIEPQLPSDLVARIERGVHVDVAGEHIAHRKPDVYVVETPVPWEQRGAVPPGTAVDEPVLLSIEHDPLVERHIEIVAMEGDEVVTAIEFLSPWNKQGAGREKYLRKRDEYLASQANLVEVDLVRVGRWLNMLPGVRVPAEHRTTFRVTVHRALKDKLELYPISLQRRLPTVRIPLRTSDPDIMLDVQALVDKAYVHGRYARTDYSKPCDPPLDDADAEWADQLLKSAGRR